MLNEKFHVIFWTIIIGLLLWCVHANNSYANGIGGSTNKNGSITLSKKEISKLSQFIISQNAQLQQSIHEEQEWRNKYNEVHKCVRDNALAGLPTTICFETCNKISMFCNAETDDF